MVTKLQKLAAQAIVNVLESGGAKNNYAAVTVIPGDTGHLSYGRVQTTLASGNLYLLVKAYSEKTGARLDSLFAPFMGRLADGDTSLDGDARFRNLLQDAAADPVMRAVQDGFADRLFWDPAAGAASELHLSEPLSIAVVYDSHIHGAWRHIRDQTVDQIGQPRPAEERRWVKTYVANRKRWLSRHSNSVLRRTAYRMEVFEALIAQDKWRLRLPFIVRGVRIDRAAIDAPDPVRASAEDPGQRVLRLTDPPMRGADVRALQNALATRGYAVNADGVYGTGTERCVRQIQAELGLTADGIAGPATLSKLGM